MHVAGVRTRAVMRNTHTQRDNDTPLTVQRQWHLTHSVCDSSKLYFNTCIACFCSDTSFIVFRLMDSNRSHAHHDKAHDSYLSANQWPVINQMTFMTHLKTKLTCEGKEEDVLFLSAVNGPSSAAQGIMVICPYVFSIGWPCASQQMIFSGLCVSGGSNKKKKSTEALCRTEYKHLIKTL